MSRTPINISLVHLPDDVSANAQAFDRLCAIFDAVSRPFIEAGLRQESLDASPVSDEEITDETGWFAQGLASLWVRTLAATIVEEGQAALGDTLLPDGFDDVRLADYPVSREDLTRIMQAFAQRAFDGTAKFTLPLGIEIEKDSAGRYQARPVPAPVS